MEVFVDRYFAIRSKYIFPLKDYKVEYDKLEYNTLKSKLKDKIVNFKIKEHNVFLIEFEKEELIKGLLGDIENFFTRTIIQYCNILQNKNTLSTCWSIVSQYYFSYFSATTLLRFMNRGNIYLDKDITDAISNVATALLGEMIKLNPGNYIFEIRNQTESIGINNDEPYLLLKYNASKGTHEQTWLSLSEAIDEYMAIDSNKRSFEYTVIHNIKEICDTYRATFPSKLRNKVNYRPEYGYKSILGVVKCPSCLCNKEELYKKICSFDNRKIDNENYQIEYMFLYGQYFFELVLKLYSEYFNRSECSFKFYEDKVNYFKNRNIRIDDILYISRKK